MKSLHQTIILFTIIIIEGYVVLSSELLAIRQTIPYVGSGTDTISIIIASVLMPLAFGYQYGGRFKPHKIFGYFITLRRKLIINMIVASTILAFGLSYVFIKHFFGWIQSLGIENNISQTAVYCLIFMAFPVYLLGQTVPLISNYFSKEKLAQITGKILFFSTVGSFLGAVFSTLVLMATLGVHHTVSLNFVLMTILVFMLEKNKKARTVLYMGMLALVSIYFNSDFIMNRNFIRSNNQYNTVQAGTTTDGHRDMIINGNFSSRYNDQGRKHAYIEFAERVSILPIIDSPEPKDILVIGAGGFTFGHEDMNNNYTYVDIDPALKDVAEKYILGEPIGKNKEFVPKPARAYLSSTDKKFDVIFLDAYLGGASIPEHLVTEEFFQSVRAHLKDRAILIGNFIAAPQFNNTFSRTLDNTLRAVFPHVSREVIDEYYNLWSDQKTSSANVIYIYKHEENYKPGHIYTDNKNTVFFDKPKKLTP